jgi:hypothetical protein
MADFNEALKTASLAILKRDLTGDEKAEFLELGGALGMDNVEDYLYMLMVFKRNEDRVNDKLTSFEDTLGAKFDELAVIEKKINDTLENSIERVLGDGAARIGMNMGDHIAERAKEALGARDDYQFLRGQVCIVCAMGIFTTLAYWMGSENALRTDPFMGPLEVLFTFSAGWWAFFCCVLYTFMWAYDHWKLVKKSPLHRSILALQGLILLTLLIYLF